MGTIELPLIMVKVLPRRYAERFVIKGQVHFSRSTQWAKAGQLGEVVRGDPLEGCFAATEAEDPFLLSMYDDVESFEQDGLVRYRRRRSGSLAIFCLYGVMAKDLDQSRVNGLGITERYTYIPKLFFDLLSNADDDSAFSKMPEDDRPAAVIITNAKAFLERLASSVNQIMGRQCRLWFGRVRYVDKSVTHLITEPHPHELMYKSMDYSYQNEFRYMIESDLASLDEFFRKTGGNVELGPLNDVAKLERGYYFKDVPILVDDRGLHWPRSIKHTEELGYIGDMTLAELVGWYYMLCEFRTRYGSSVNDEARLRFEQEILSRTGAESVTCDVINRKVIVNSPDNPDDVNAQARVGNVFFENGGRPPSQQN